MAKRTNGDTTKTTAGKTKGTTGETKARRAPARRRTDGPAADAPVATASDLAQPGHTDTATHAAATIELQGAEFSPNTDEVARRAYEIYVGRGGANGCDVDDWLEAERQLRSRPH